MRTRNSYAQTSLCWTDDEAILAAKLLDFATSNSTLTDDAVVAAFSTEGREREVSRVDPAAVGASLLPDSPHPCA